MHRLQVCPKKHATWRRHQAVALPAPRCAYSKTPALHPASVLRCREQQACKIGGTPTQRAAQKPARACSVNTLAMRAGRAWAPDQLLRGWQAQRQVAAWHGAAQGNRQNPDSCVRQQRCSEFSQQTRWQLKAVEWRCILVHMLEQRAAEAALARALTSFTSSFTAGSVMPSGYILKSSSIFLYTDRRLDSGTGFPPGK